MSLRTFLTLLFTVLLTACGSPSPDSGTITHDITGDAASDAATDTGTDAGTVDTGSHVVDAAPDVSLDSAVDSAVADASDAGADTAETSPNPGVCGVCGPHTTCNGNFCVAGYRIFVSSTTYTAQLGGYEGAAALCQQLAINAGLSGTWAAWMSGAIQSDKAPVTDFTKGSNYQLIDGTPVASSLGALARPVHDIDMDENGSHVDNAHVWTNTNQFGTSLPYACGDMNSSNPADTEPGTGRPSGKAGFGFTSMTYAVNDAGLAKPYPSWAYAGVDPCSVANHLYCVEQ